MFSINNKIDILGYYLSPLARLFIAIIFLMSGLNKIGNYENTAYWMEAVGVPSLFFPNSMAALSIFSSSPSAKITLLGCFLTLALIPCIKDIEGSNRLVSSSLYCSKFEIFKSHFIYSDAVF